MNALITPITSGVSISFYEDPTELARSKTVIINLGSHAVKNVDQRLPQMPTESIIDWFRARGYI